MENQFYLSKLCKGYKIVLEESFAHEKMEGKTQDRRWYERVICCCGGHIMLYAEVPDIILDFYTPKARPTATKIYELFKNVPGVKIDNHFSGHESIFYFPAHLLDKVVKMAGARRRRVLSEKQKEKLKLGREKAGLTRDEKGRLVHVQAHDNAQFGPIST